jgi:ubiquitin-like 1-activating enzyme E1 B
MIKVNKLELIYGKQVAETILSSNVLVVGAGGIGCELMKTLSVTGFPKVSIVIQKFKINDFVD